MLKNPFRARAHAGARSISCQAPHDDLGARLASTFWAAWSSLSSLSERVGVVAQIR